MDRILKMLRSKTVWGSIILAASQWPGLSDYADYLKPIGMLLMGTGVAHKLDKIHEAAGVE
jgi:hypothetical protein